MCNGDVTSRVNTLSDEVQESRWRNVRVAIGLLVTLLNSTSFPGSSLILPLDLRNVVKLNFLNVNIFECILLILNSEFKTRLLLK